MSDQDAVLDLPPFEKVGRKLYFAYGAMHPTQLKNSIKIAKSSGIAPAAFCISCLRGVY
jgi:hypothetical protein